MLQEYDEHSTRRQCRRPSPERSHGKKQQATHGKNEQAKAHDKRKEGCQEGQKGRSIPNRATEKTYIATGIGSSLGYPDVGFVLG